MAYIPQYVKISSIIFPSDHDLSVESTDDKNICPFDVFAACPGVYPLP